MNPYSSSLAQRLPVWVPVPVRRRPLRAAIGVLALTLAVAAAGCLGLSSAVAWGAGPPPADPTTQVLGTWLTQDRDGLIQISRAADGTYQGRIVGGDDPDGLDTRNPDPALRGQRLWGTLILHGLHYDGDGQWTGGLIYDPDSGHNYHCSLTLIAPDRVKLRGYIGIPLFGRSQTWTRYLGTSMHLPKSGVSR